MNEQNLLYISNLKIEDVPWSRLTTAYGRASGFPEVLERLETAIDGGNLTDGGAFCNEKNSVRKPTQNGGSNLANNLGNRQNAANLTKDDEAKFEMADSATSKFKTGATNDGSNFDAADIDDALEKIFNEIEHQSTFWHATPFALVFLARIFMRAREAVKDDKNGENEATELIATRLGEFFAFMLMVCDDTDKIAHAAPLANFADMIAEKYLWPENDENDEELWGEGFYDDEIFYSFYFYSRAVLDATGVDFAPFKPVR